MEERKVRGRNLVAYGMGDIFGGGAFLVIGMLFMFFLTEVLGISPVMAGLVFAVGKVWDAVSDPLMGYLSDRTRSRFGRRRVYFLWGILPIGLSFFLMWLSLPHASQPFKIVYYSFAYILFNTVFTMVMVPYSALNAEMTADYKVRSRLSGARSIFSGLAALLSGTLPNIIIGRYETLNQGYAVMAGVFALLFALPWIFVFMGTWEQDVEIPENKGGLEIFREFRSIIKNRSFRTHIIMYICAYTAMDILMALFAYFLTYYLKSPGSYAIAMGSLLLTQIIMMPLYVLIGNKKGKGFAYRMGLLLWIGGMLLSLTLSPQSPLVLLVAVCVLTGTGTSAGVMIPWAILPSVIDVDELMVGYRRSGLYAGAMTLIRKLIQGLIAMPLVGFMLKLIGFVSNQDQSPQALQGMRMFYVLGPVLLLTAGFFMGFRFYITPETHEILSGERERLKKGGLKSDVTNETRAVCEKITGLAYEDLKLGKSSD